jgi:hypothetical protein
MAHAFELSLAMAKVILAIIGKTHDDVLEMGWPGSYEFYCPSMFDVKLSYDPYGGYGHKGCYYLKSYPNDPMGNMCHFLRFHIMWVKGLREDNPPTWHDHTDIRKSMYQYIAEHKDRQMYWWIETDELKAEFAVILQKVRIQA